ncbi:limonoid UDP-glucosyltransferase-like protein [Medicago truncatula]|uniref:Limonoid UDP-glucosyltransferase-like protein n=1 Tax=Medicago truncatula TaxID=3880 RepID=A0A072UE01_MEDTR|nr:limonoid UDP-glucosyltransferase-like protein [Medicago truncatula]
MNEIKGKMGCDNDIVEHVFLVSFPAQGHVNPLLRLGKLLASKGLAVTFCTLESWGKEMRKARDLEEEKEVVIGKGFIRFEWFEDGWDEDEPKRLDLDVYLPQLEMVGKQVLPTIISQQNPPVSCLINNPFIPWVSDVAQSLSLPSALLWIQSCASFSTYYHYYHKLVSFPSQSHPHIHVQLPCMPLLNYDQPDDDCIEWLSSKPTSSVVYISFGSIVYLKQEQIDEIAYGLLQSGVSFLWVMKPPHKDSGKQPHMLPDGILEKTKSRGKVVRWSPQEQVLAHRSIACFVTHCGWNSSMEAIASGVPVVAFPQWGDQGEAANELINRDEVNKCLLEATVGTKAKEIKQNVLSLKAAAEAAIRDGGSSHRNIESFVDEIRKRSIEMRSKSMRLTSIKLVNG